MDPEIGYVQGMNMIASVLVFHGKHITECVELFRYLMLICGFRDLYLKEFGLAYRCADTVVRSLNLRCHDLYRHLVWVLLIVGWG